MSIFKITKLFYNENYDKIFSFSKNKQARDVLNGTKEEILYWQDDKTPRLLRKDIVFPTLERQRG